MGDFVELPALIDALRAARSPHTGDLAAFLARGALRADESVLPPTTDIKGLLTTFGIREKVLARHDTPHARALRRDVVAFCAALESAPEARGEWILLRTDRDGEVYSRWRDVGSGAILGCMHTWDKRAVSDDEWKSLWGE